MSKVEQFSNKYNYDELAAWNTRPFLANHCFLVSTEDLVLQYYLREGTFFSDSMKYGYIAE